MSEGDARSLSWADESVDLFLLMGPLYHLIIREDRLTALSEARRVLKNGGILIVTGVNRFASLVDGLMNGYIDDPDFMTILYRDLSDGRHLPDSHVQAYAPGETVNDTTHHLRVVLHETHEGATGIAAHALRMVLVASAQRGVGQPNNSAPRIRASLRSKV